MFLSAERLSLLPLALGLAILAWDVLLAGWIASQRQTSRPFTNLTGLCGLLVAPAALISMATMLDGTARTTAAIAWIWPAVTICFCLQTTYAILARLVTPAVGIPLLIYNLCVATVSVSDYLVAASGSAPIWLQGAVAARDAIAGLAAGRTALVSPVALLVPMIAPAYRARWKASAGVRALLTLTATAVSTLLLMEWPRGVGAVRSYDAASGVRLQERPAGDFTIGLRLLPPLDGPPLARLVTADRKLADTLGADALLIVLDDEGTRAAALDSLSRVLEPWRADSAIIAVAMAMGRSPGQPASAGRLAAVERVLQHLRPDVLIPGWRAPLPTVLPAQEPGLLWWQTMLNGTAQVIQRVRPRTVLGWAASHVDIRDSAVYDWAASAASPVRLLGVVSFPSFAGLPAVDARLRAFDRWHARASTQYDTQREHWVVEAGGLPRAHGDAAQTAAILQALAWSTRRPWVSVVIIGDASDYGGGTGLRAADGRLRQAVGVVSRASRGMKEAALGGR